MVGYKSFGREVEIAWDQHRSSVAILQVDAETNLKQNEAKIGKIIFSRKFYFATIGRQQ